MNKVLNRPLFRKAALKKGYIKPIKARVGEFIGPQQFRPPAVIPPPVVQGPVMGGPSVTNPRRQLMNVPQQGMLGRGLGSILRYGLSVPFFVGADLTGRAIESQNPNVSTPRKLLGQGIGGTAAALGAARIAPAALSLGTGPGLLALGLYGTGDYLVREGIKERKRIKAMTPEERKRFFQENRAKAFDYMSEGVSDRDLFGNFTPRPVNIKSTKKTDTRSGQGRPSSKFVPEKNLNEMGPNDELADPKYAGAGEANLNRVQEDVISPTLPGGEDPDDPKDTKTIAEVEKIEQPKTKIQQTATKDINKSTANTIQTGGASDDPIFNKNIKLARQYFDELNKGQSSQAKLVFLSNLASGLLTGTTTRGGVGGALEVFGQALGPAVNNMVTVKLKEGELRAKRRETSLNAALEHMEFVNKGAARPEIDDRGVIQIRGSDGKLRNYRGVYGKDGTTFLFGGLGQDGREILVPIQQQGNIVDSNGNVLGTFEDFKSQKDLGARLFDLQDILGNRYNALSVTSDVLKTLGQIDEEGEKPKAGAALTVDAFIRRFTGVAKELAGLNVIDDITNLSTSALEGKLEELYQREMNAIERSDLSDKEKERARKQIDKDSLLSAAKRRLKARGLFSGLNRDEQEKLAVQETTLVYALANTFKDQDRLTQRDINAAREIVNIFSLRRSSKDVEASIKAIGQQLESDIRRTESLYREAGGLEATILRLRKLAEFETFDQGTVPQTLLKDFSPEEIEEGLQDVQL